MFWLQLPISKLILQHDGRIQDTQLEDTKLDLDIVSHLSFTLNDAHTGPFYLELDYIAIQRNKNHKEEFAYEKYNVPAHYLYN